MDVSEKSYVEKRLLQIILIKDEAPHTDKIACISARSLTLSIFAVGWALCGRPQPNTSQ